MSETPIYVIIPAAGESARFGTTSSSNGGKLFVSIRGVSVIQRTISKFVSLPGLQKLIVVHKPGFLEAFSSVFKSPGNFCDKIEFVTGGAERHDSVSNALKYLESQGVNSSDLVLVHDAARCLLPQEALMRVVKRANETGAATLGMPVTDTIVRSYQGDYSKVARDNLWSIQTPQVFRFDLLKQAHMNKPDDTTDDAGLVASFHPVEIVLGEHFNLKLTYFEQVSLFEAIAATLD